MNIALSPPHPPPQHPRLDEAEILALGLAFLAARAAGRDGEAECAAWRTARDDHGASALDRIAEAFGLSRFEEELLLLVAAADLDGALLPSSARPTLHWVARLLFGADRLPPEAWAALHPHAPLRRHHLLLLEGPLSLATPLAVPPSLFLALAGAPARLPQLPVLALPPRLEALARELPPRLLLVGPNDSGRRAIAAQILERAGLAAHEAPTGADPVDAVRDARLAGGAPVLALAGTPASDTLLPHGLPEGPLILLATAPPATALPLPLHRLPPLSPPERAFLWRTLAPAMPADEAAAHGQRLPLGPAGIAAAKKDGTAAALAPAHAALETLATRRSPHRTLSDMVLDKETCDALDWLLAAASASPALLESWGPDAPPAARGCAALFAGASGTGKTMAAEALASALGLDLFTVDLARVVSKYIGETERNLKTIFDAAEAGGALLFFDEADALFGKRSEVKDAHDRYANQEVAYLLHRMEQHAGVAILATNLRTHIDPAFLRRLRFVIDFALPDVAQRALLWDRAIPPALSCSGIDRQRLARLELSGGNIMTIAANAAARALADGVPLGMAHLLAAARLEYRKLDRDPAPLGRAGG